MFNVIYDNALCPPKSIPHYNEKIPAPQSMLHVFLAFDIHSFFMSLVMRYFQETILVLTKI